MNQIIKMGDDFAEVELHGGTEVIAQQSSSGEAIIGENYEVTQDEFDKIVGYKNKTTRNKTINGIIKDRSPIDKEEK